MSRIFLFFSILLLAQRIFSTDIHEYEIKHINTIPIGNEEGEIGFKRGMYNRPGTFTIGPDLNIYVPDRLNERINVYDSECNYLYTIHEKRDKQAQFALRMGIDKYNNIIYLAPDFYFRKINNGGKILFSLSHEEDDPEVTEALDINRFFIIEDYVFYYDDNGYIRCISPNGKIQKPSRTLQILNEINKGSLLSYDSDEEEKVFHELSQDRKHIMVGDKYYPRSLSSLENYYEQLQKKSKSISTLKSKLSKVTSINRTDLSRGSFIGIDKDHNSYWSQIQESTRKLVVIIHSKYGTPIDVFYYGDKNNRDAYATHGSNKAVAPNGDVYFMKSDEAGTHFWKVERKW